MPQNLGGLLIRVLKKLEHCSIEQKLEILNWRNDIRIRSNMSNSDIILENEHLEFISSLSNKSEVDYRVVFDGNQPVGIVNLVNISNLGAELGLYKNPNISRKGVGSILMDSIIELAKEKKIKKLSLKVKSNNKIAISLYKKYHFCIINKDEKYIYMELNIDDRVYIIAELSANHNKNIQIAKDTIKAAFDSGADAVKIQTYTADTITIDSDFDFFKISNGSIWDGRTLHDLYSEAYTPWEWYEELKDYANTLGIDFFSTPFDRTAVDFLEERKNPIYKIASFEITDIPLIEYVASKGKPVIISTGIAEIGEIYDAVEACRRMHNNSITLLKCTSSYPAPIEEFNLRTMLNMRDTFDVKVGLSDHSIGSDVAIAAAALGASVIEKHLILNDNVGGPDASFSMLPIDFSKMVVSIRNVEQALGKITYSLSEGSKKNRLFSRSLFVVEDIKEGELLTSQNIKSIRPADGLSPKYYKQIIGMRATISIERGTPLSWGLVK